MKAKTKKRRLTEAEKDAIVIAEADDRSAWLPPVKIKRKKAGFYSIPADIAARAAFLARLHRVPKVDEWLAGVIRERVELEEVAFATACRELAGNGRTR